MKSFSILKSQFCCAVSVCTNKVLHLWTKHDDLLGLFLSAFSLTLNFSIRTLISPLVHFNFVILLSK